MSRLVPSDLFQLHFAPRRERSVSPIESLPPEIQVKILCYINSPYTLINVVQASRSLHILYKAHREYIATAVTINETLARGIQLIRHSRLPIAYVECWASPSFTPVLGDALREVLSPTSRKLPILSLPQCAAIRGLGVLSGWTLELGDYGPARVRPCTRQFDDERVEMHGYDATNFQLLPLVEGGTPHAFEAMYNRWLREDHSKKGQDKTMAYDSHGNLIRVKAYRDKIMWSGKRVYFVGGIEHYMELLCFVIVVFLLGLLSVVLGVSIMIAGVLLIEECTRSIAWWKALLY